MPTYRQLLSFYIPLMVQAVSQCLTYPLVAMVVVRGSLGSDALAAFAQGQTVMFILGTLGVGLVTTGMLHARNRDGFRNFFRLNIILMIIVATLQLLASLPPFNHLVFGKILNLNDDIYNAAVETLFLCLPSHILFMLRTPYQVMLYNIRASGRANCASMGRVIATALLAYVWCQMFPESGGIRPAALVFSLPIAIEVLVSRAFAIRHIRALEVTRESTSVREQFKFNLPLTLGGFLLSLTAFIIAIFIGRAADPTNMLTVHFVVMGIVNPMLHSALRVQTVTLSFITSHGNTVLPRLVRFGIMVGAALGGIVLLLQIPAIADWYFGGVQKLSPGGISMAMTAALCLAPLPILQALRAHTEGIAAWSKRPRLILSGQLAYLLALIATLCVQHALHVPGHLMGVIAISVAVVATQLTIRMGLANSNA